MASKGTLVIRILGDEKPLEGSLGRATGIMRSWTKGAIGIFAGLGAGAAALFVSEFGDALERDRLGDRLAAQLDLTPEESERYGKIAGELYASAYGDSLGQVFDAVDAVASSLDGLDDGALERVTAKALDLAATFEVDVQQAVNAAAVAVKSGLARDADHAFDLIVASMQKVPREMRGELIPIVEEYAQFLGQLGIDGEEAFGLLVAAASSGRFELDKVGDALKELTIRATDMSTASTEAFEAAGLDAEEMAARFLAGGEIARAALGDLVDGLLAIEDPVARANAAIALFGTPLEDLSTSEIQDFLAGLDTMESKLDDVGGAAERMGDKLNDNAATKIEEFKRRATTAIETWVEASVLPHVEEVLAAFDEGGIGGALDKAVELWEASQPRVEAWFEGTFIPWFSNTAVPWMTYIGAEMGTALVNGLIEVLANAAPRIQLTLFEVISKAAPGGLVGLVGNLFGDAEIPTITVPDLPNPVAPPSSPAGTVPTTGSLQLGRFHDGGLAVRGGLAEIARKERVLSPRQTAAFERLVEVLDRGGSGGGSMTWAPVFHLGDAGGIDEAVWEIRKFAEQVR